MTYATDHFAETLKNVRMAKGITQRALGERVALPQGYISKIENGVVDLRVSSLVELARALNMELMLVPRKAVPAVQSIARGNTEPDFLAGGSLRRTRREFARLQEGVAGLVKLHPSSVELAGLARRVRELQHFLIPHQHLGTIRDVRKAVESYSHDSSQGLNGIDEYIRRLVNLRNSLAHGLAAGRESESTRPAYSLDEDEDG